MGKKPKAVKPQPLQLYNEQCSICLEDLDDKCDCYSELECKHKYHAGCLINWYRRSNEETIRLILPFDDLPHIHFFPDGVNTVKCPICLADYTVELELDPISEAIIPKDRPLKRILGKVNMLHCDGKTAPIVITHYVTDLNTFNLFKFFANIPDDLTGEPITIHLRQDINDGSD